MLFNSFEFIFWFLPVTLTGFFLLGHWKKYNLAAVFLTLASFFFYAWWNPPYVLLILISIGINYAIGSALAGTDSEDNDSQRKLMLIGGIFINLLLLGYYKYANFFADSVNAVLSTDFNFGNIILPLGISFFTFQQIGYLVDSYKGETKEYTIVNYSLFVSFFPQLIAGPIVHHKDVMSQFWDKQIYRVDWKNIAIGLTIFIIGLAKKILIADHVAQYATPVFNAVAEGQSISFYEAWAGALSYTFQLYFDFSGYSDMAIGIARLFGIRLPINFDSPYKASSITEFWRRWHITLSNFLRDYLYIPLGGNRKGELRRNANLIITMLLGGLWHGAGLTFIIWGGLHGLYLTINHQWRSLRKRLNWSWKDDPFWMKAIGLSITFPAVIVSWVFFRADSPATAFSILHTMAGLDGLSMAASIIPVKKKLLLLLCLAVWLMPNTVNWLSQYQPVLHMPQEAALRAWQSRWWRKLQWKPSPVIGAGLGIASFCILKTMMAATKSEFLYFNF